MTTAAATRAPKTVAQFAALVRNGDRRALARAITLVESTRADHRGEADELLNALLPASNAALRIGISGPPGVGKSTFIEAFGLFLIAAGHRPAVLAIDPTSPRSGGSILGDKTRMTELSRASAAYIRPSPTGGALGGVTRRTRESLLVCAAAGFDVVLVETVGVGQSETDVADMVDMFVLMVPPAGGDELQGLKKGIVEVADMVLVNKADGDLTVAAGRTASEYRAALHLLRPGAGGWSAPVLKVSAEHRIGIDAVWKSIAAYRDLLGEAGLAARRAAQAKAWLWREIEDGLIAELRADSHLSRRIKALETKVFQSTITPSSAAAAILAEFRRGA
jgi:LAO/AO transport system kinase